MSKELDFFDIPDQPAKKQALTPEEAKDIIRLFRSGKDETTIFIDDGYPRYKIEAAKKEWLRLKAEVYKKVSGSYVTKEGVLAENDAKGKEIKPAIKPEYFDPKTKTVVQNSLVSDLFTGKEVVDDILAYDEKMPWLPASFSDFKDKYYNK